MSMNCSMLAGLCVLAASVAVRAETPAPPTPMPEDFAYALPISLQGPGPLYEFTLPTEVYQALTRADAGDLRVFNARGEMVPQALRASPPAVAATTTPVELPLFPVYIREGQDTDDLSVQVQRNARGAVVSVRSAGAAGGARRLSAYVLDVTALRAPLQALELHWAAPGPDGFVAEAEVAESTDLHSWRVVAVAPIASLRHDAQILERRRIELSTGQTRYLRLRFNTTVPSLTLVHGELRAEATAPDREWLRVSGRATDTAGVWTFDVPGRVPADRVRVNLPQANTVVSVELLSRAGEQAPWRSRGGGLLYRLRTEAGEITSPDLSIGAAGDPQWMIRATQDGGGLGSGTPVLELGWVPQRLVFAARGDGPFQLAYGSLRIGRSEQSVERLIEQFTQAGETRVVVSPAGLGERRVLAGEQALLPPQPGFPWKTTILWSVLVLSVLVAGWMVRQLVRQMNVPPAAK